MVVWGPSPEPGSVAPHHHPGATTAAALPQGQALLPHTIAQVQLLQQPYPRATTTPTPGPGSAVRGIPWYFEGGRYYLATVSVTDPLTLHPTLSDNMRYSLLLTISHSNVFLHKR